MPCVKRERCFREKLFYSGRLILGTGCATKVHKEWLAIGGSKADATVRLAVVWNPQIAIPEYSELQASELAAQKCQTWGYAGAEPFGSQLVTCTQLVSSNWGPICYQVILERRHSAGTVFFSCTAKLHVRKRSRVQVHCSEA